MSLWFRSELHEEIHWLWDIHLIDSSHGRDNTAPRSAPTLSWQFCMWFMTLILKAQPRAFPLGPSMILWIMQYSVLLQWILQSSPKNADKYGIFGQKYLDNTGRNGNMGIWLPNVFIFMCSNTCVVLQNGALIILYLLIMVFNVVIELSPMFSH